MSIRKFFSKFIFVKQNVALKSFLFDILQAFLVINCIIVFKIPHDDNNTILLNCFYFLVILFFVGMQIDRILQSANDENYKMSLVVKVVYWSILFFGLSLCCMHWDYIGQHITEWGNFNKVAKR